MTKRIVAAVALSWLALVVPGKGQSARGAVAPVRFVREISWAGRGSWIAADTHTHSKFSDGTSPAAEVVDKAAQFGCQAVAIADHSDGNLWAATPDYAAAVAAARQAHPSMAVVAGLEWNIPPWAGAEHATVLVPPGAKELTTLSEFKRQFDDYHRTDHDSLDSITALRWLAANGPERGIPPVVVYNHPSRKTETSMANIADVERWRALNDLFIGFEGGPGHQGKPSPGDYLFKEKTVDRWDPAVARVGDMWDTLLQKGLVVSGAYASSDFHNAEISGDRWPCEFSETWLYVPEVSPTGVLRALAAGAMWGAHGHIARSVQFSVEAKGLARAAMAGEAITVPSGSSVTATLRLDVPAIDWAGQPNRIDELELIAITRTKVAVIATRAPNTTGEAFRETVVVPSGGVTLRLRGRRIVPGGPNLMFYTNPIWIGAGS